MAEQISNYQCPACTGPLHFESTTGKMECEYCGSVYEVKEIEALYAEQNAAAAAAETQWAMPTEYMSSEGMKAYRCSACGAELVCEETTAATSCPYCGNPAIVPSQFTEMMKPDYVIPFKLNKQSAVEALKAHYKGKILLPKTFQDQNHIEEIKGVYVPFWMYDGEAEGSARFEGTKTRTFQTAEEDVTQTDHFDVFRAGNMSFEKIPADASSKMPDDLMDSIEPYDYKALTPFTHAYMAGYMADRYDVSAEDNAERVVARAKESLHQTLRNDVKGYGSVSDRSSNLTVHQGKVQYALMPVWLLSTQWNGSNFLFAMNGQTGKLVGDLPVDKGKYWRYFGLSFLITALITFMILGGNLEDGFSMAMLVLIPTLAAFIVGAIMKSSMKSVAKATTANDYTVKGGTAITQRSDHFTHTTETRTPRAKAEPKK